MQDTMMAPGFVPASALLHYPADAFPSIHPVRWLHSHFAVGGWSPLQRLGGMLTAHMTRIAPHSGFTWHPHRGLEIYTWVLEGMLLHEDTTGGQGEIGPLQLQRMFSGDYIEHQELNPTDQPVRVIQIWYLSTADAHGLPPHYQQLGRDALPVRRSGDARVFSLIGDGSPMQQHMRGRLTATLVEPGGRTALDAPRPDEDLFAYVTDGRGNLDSPLGGAQLNQYDVLLARPDAPESEVRAGQDAPLHILSFYLPRFLPSRAAPDGSGAVSSASNTFALR